MLSEFEDKPAGFTSEANNNLPYYVWLLFTILSLIYGYFGLYQVFGKNTIQFIKFLNLSTREIASLLTNTFISLFVIALVAIIGAYILLQIFAALGEEFLLFVYFGIPGILAILGVYLGVTQTFAAFFLVIPLIVVIIFRKKIIAAARLFEYSVEQVTGNMQTTIPMLVAGILKALTWIGFLGAEIFTIRITENVSNEIRYVIGLILFFLYSFIVLGLNYYFEAANVYIFNNVYHGVEDKSLRSAFREVKQVRGAIIIFAFLMALVSLIRKIMRDVERANRVEWSDNKSKSSTIFTAVSIYLFSILIQLLLGIYVFLNYYTLIIIMTEKKSVKDATLESTKMLPKTMVASIAGNIGIAAAEVLYKLLVLVILSVSGYYFGVIIGWKYNLGDSYIIISILMIFLFTLVGYGPMVTVFQPVFTAYKTFLFNVAKDVMSGKELPSHIPPKLREAMVEVVHSMGDTKYTIPQSYAPLK